MKTNEWEKAGEVTVEGGCLSIKESHRDGLHYLKGYEKAVLKNDPSCWPAHKGYLATHDEMGVILGGFGGDGVFPVYIRRNADGLIVEAIIVFHSGPPLSV